MLKSKPSVSACSLSSCRIRAEALAGAFNDRIGPCVWSRTDEAGMSKGVDDDEEFFDASPVEADEEPLFSAAGRAKLYELLQQHAADDAIDVFYDVSEEAGLTCLRDDEGDSEYPEGEEKPFSLAQSTNDVPEYFERESGNKVGLDFSIPPLSKGDEPVSDEETLDGDLKGDKEMTGASEKCESPSNNCAVPESSSTVQDKISETKNVPSEITKDTYLVSTNSDVSENGKTPVESGFEAHLVHSDDNPIGANAETVSEGDVVAIEITVDTGSPPSDASDSKVTSPNSRLQVFEESRPKISRSTSLKTGKTPPGTPSRKKIVRFADVLGLDLEDVRHIMSGDVPIVPSSAYTDLNLKGIDLPVCEPISETIEISRPASWNSHPGATAPNVLYPAFPLPGEQFDFMLRVRSQGICLQTVTVSEMSVHCTCRVMNYGFHKKVTARYTVNDWQSSNDIDASYISGSSDSESDGFAFSIFLSPPNKRVQLALKYAVNGQEYWDNNGGHNYGFNYHAHYNMHQLPTSPSWQHQFW